MSASHDQRLIEQANARIRELQAERDYLLAFKKQHEDALACLGRNLSNGELQPGRCLSDDELVALDRALMTDKPGCALAVRYLKRERDELRAKVDDQRARYESLQRYLDKISPIADAARVLIVQITPGEPCADPDCNACRFFAACAAYDEHLAGVDAGFKRWMEEQKAALSGGEG